MLVLIINKYVLVLRLTYGCNNLHDPNDETQHLKFKTPGMKDSAENCSQRSVSPANITWECVNMNVNVWVSAYRSAFWDNVHF